MKALPLVAAVAAAAFAHPALAQQAAPAPSPVSAQAPAPATQAATLAVADSAAEREYHEHDVDRIPRLKNETAVWQYFVQHFPTALAASGFTGTATVRTMIDTAGVPQRVQLYHTSGNVEVDRLALTTVAMLRFRPAQVHHQPVRMWMDLPLGLSSHDRADPNPNFDTSIIPAWKRDGRH